MWQKKLQHNINQVPTQYQYWVAKDGFDYTEEHRQVLELSRTLWLKETAPFVSKKIRQLFIQNNLLHFSEIWSDNFVQHFLDAGWKVIPVNGIVSQKVFFELLNLGFLPFAVNIRTIEYLKDPLLVDFIHDFFQFHRVLVDNEFSEFLQVLGRVGSMVIFNAADVKINRILKSFNRTKYNHSADSDNVKIEHLRAMQTFKQFSGEPLSEAGELVNFYYKTFKFGALGNSNEFDLVGTYWNLSFFSINEALKSAEQRILTLEEINRPESFLLEDKIYFFPSYAYLTVLLEKIEQSLTVKKDAEDIIKSAITSDFPVKLTLDNSIQIVSNFIDIEKYSISKASQLWFVKGIGKSKVFLHEDEIFESEDGYDLLYWLFSGDESDLENSIHEKDKHLHIKFSEFITLDGTIEDIFVSSITGNKIFQVKDCYIYLNEKIIFHKKYIVPVFNKITGIKPTFIDSKDKNIKKSSKIFKLNQPTQVFEYFQKLKQGLNEEAVPAQYSWLIELMQKTA